MSFTSFFFLLIAIETHTQRLCSLAEFFLLKIIVSLSKHVFEVHIPYIIFHIEAFSVDYSICIETRIKILYYVSVCLLLKNVKTCLKRTFFTSFFLLITIETHIRSFYSIPDFLLTH